MKMIMFKNRRRLTLTTTLMLIAVGLVGGSFIPAAYGQTNPKTYMCSAESLNGRFANMGSGFVTPGPPPTPSVPFATVSLMTLDGAGGLTNKVTRSTNGVISRSIDPGSYTVNEDCTGTLTINASPFPLTFDLVISEIQGTSVGLEFCFIATTPGGVVTTTAKRIQ